MLTFIVLSLPVAVLATCLVLVVMFLDVAFRPATQWVYVPLTSHLPLTEGRSVPHWPTGLTRLSRDHYGRQLRKQRPMTSSRSRIHRPRNALLGSR
jgi:hypothetical protein